MAIVLLILGLLLFVGLVVIHEFGHYIAAKRNGVEVEEFGIGFPPTAKVLGKRDGTRITLNWLPFGGFVKLKGEHDADTEKGSFGAASLWVKTKILLAGVAMNLLAAAALLTVIGLVGLPKANLADLPFYDREQFTVASDERLVDSSVFVGVVEGSPADQAGLEDGDEIISVNDLPIETSQELIAASEVNAGFTVPVEYRRDGETKTSEVAFNAEPVEGQRFFGVSPLESQRVRYTWSAPIVGAGLTLQYGEVTLRGLGYAIGSLFAGQNEVAKETVSGPVRVVQIMNEVSQTGVIDVLFLIAIISLSLAVMNVLPVPALDGGRLFVMLVFRAVRRPLTRKTEEWINATGFVALLALIVLITIVDVGRIL